MDAIDFHLLDLVQRDANLTHERLGEITGASASAVHRRLKKLHADGAIKRVTTVVDQKVLGRPLTFVVGLEIERKQVDLYASLQRWLLGEDAVQQTYNVTGSNDFVVVITSASMDDYDALMEQMIAANPNIKKYVTQVVLRSFKQSLFVPSMPPGSRQRARTGAGARAAR